MVYRHTCSCEGIGKFSYSFTASENKNGSYNLNLTITDRYDFDAKAELTYNLQAAFANAAGYSCQVTDILNNYDVEINLNDSITIDDNNNDDDKEK